MKKLIVAVVVIMIAVFTNPSKADHEAAVKEMLMESISGELSSGASGNASNSLAYMIGSAMVDKVVDTAVRPRNYILFSLTKFNYKGERKTVGVGAFGNVWLFGKVSIPK